jgi:hypothetical protein
MVIYVIICDIWLDKTLYIISEIKINLILFHLILMGISMAIWSVGFIASTSVLKARLQFWCINEKGKLVRGRYGVDTKMSPSRLAKTGAATKILDNNPIVNYNALGLADVYEAVDFLANRDNVMAIITYPERHPVDFLEIESFRIKRIGKKKITISADYFYKGKLRRNKKMTIYNMYNDMKDLAKYFVMNQEGGFNEHSRDHLKMNNELLRVFSTNEETDLKKAGKRIKYAGLALSVALLAGSFYCTITVSASKAVNFQEVLDEYSNKYSEYGFVADIGETSGSISLTREEAGNLPLSKIELNVMLDGSLKNIKYSLFYSPEKDAEDIYNEANALFKIVGESLAKEKTLDEIALVQSGELANASFKTSRPKYYLMMTSEKFQDSDERFIYFYYYSWQRE